MKINTQFDRQLGARDTSKRVAQGDQVQRSSKDHDSNNIYELSWVI